MRICVYGAASPTIDKKYIELVEEFGREMGRRGHSLVFGCGNNGLMGAAARGVKEMGGYILGVIPKFFEDETVEEIYSECDKTVMTDTMRERKQIMEDNADAFVVVPGGIGTYEEFFEILTLKQLCRHNKPIALYNIDGYYNEINVALKGGVDKNFIRHDCMDLFICTENTEEIFNYVEEPVKEIRTIKELKDG